LAQALVHCVGPFLSHLYRSLRSSEASSMPANRFPRFGRVPVKPSPARHRRPFCKTGISMRMQHIEPHAVIVSKVLPSMRVLGCGSVCRSPLLYLFLTSLDVLPSPPIDRPSINRFLLNKPRTISSSKRSRRALRPEVYPIHRSTVALAF